ncbi:MAG: hypothetical protein O7C61_02005, partial [SAR324 cluster bacterium]|nr:hypothetical protein [SAR324 cluster bacterium]
DPPTADCAAFVQGIFGLGFQGSTQNDAAANEPTDFRRTAVDEAFQLTSVWPTGLDTITTFVFSQPPSP